ncbi:UvrD-helicase domain-containing protein [Schaalia sp. Marseille-Q2122]|uniref:UvrD-helicase domain-containing protein n=1 Tax=Schaalia sp. Marseille-Q2122 TaxID=2736604 RepID=UPI0020CA4052|nr:UvrD-helicase domain-containing protein [Schaalia sp. Marseille-Q2122]
MSTDFTGLPDLGLPDLGLPDLDSFDQGLFDMGTPASAPSATTTPASAGGKGGAPVRTLDESAYGLAPDGASGVGTRGGDPLGTGTLGAEHLGTAISSASGMPGGVLPKGYVPADAPAYEDDAPADYVPAEYVPSEYVPADDAPDDNNAWPSVAYPGGVEGNTAAYYGGGGLANWGNQPPAIDTSELLKGLNQQQHDAVVHEGEPLLIMAGAGSGKTRVLTHRIAYLLATGRARAGQILAITFTNKAAAEMRERVADLVGPEAKRMMVSTFHSACVRILRKEYRAAGLSSTFTIYDSQDSQRLLQMVLKSHDVDIKRYTPKLVAARISDLKNELISPQHYAETAPNDPISRIVSAAYSDYDKRLRQANALDFDDLIMRTVALLRDNPAVAEHYHRRFRHILVDEYQDTNHAQYVLVRELVGDGEDHVPPAELTVVGDSDQSIYAFRGATIRNIEEFERDFPGARTIMLEQNYRSTQNILTAANAVISRNEGRRPKNLWTDSGAGSLITLDAADSDRDEARFVVAEIDRLNDEGTNWGDIAVFYRTNAQSRSIEELFVRQGIPYRVVGGTRFYERKEIKDALAYLQAIANPDDTVALRRVLNTPRRGIGAKAEELLVAYADQYGISFGQAIADVWEQAGRPAGEAEGLEVPGALANTSESARLVSGRSPEDEVSAGSGADAGALVSPMRPGASGAASTPDLTATNAPEPADSLAGEVPLMEPEPTIVEAAETRETTSPTADRGVERPGPAGVSARALKAIAGFWGLLDALRRCDQAGMSVGDILEEVLDRTGYLEQLRRSEDPQDASRVENLAELHSVAEDFNASLVAAQAERSKQAEQSAQTEQAVQGAPGARGVLDAENPQPHGHLVDFLERISLVADSDQLPSEDGRSGQVTLMTVHTAKGLEFPIVFVTGMEDGTFPHQRSLGEVAELAEERRLAYVAITRARERLYLTRAAVRSAWGTPQEMPPSRFLDDIPEEVVHVRRAASSMQRIRSGEWGTGSGYGGSGYRSGGGDTSGSYGSSGRRGEWDDDGPVIGSGRSSGSSSKPFVPHRLGTTVRMGQSTGVNGAAGQSGVAGTSSDKPVLTLKVGDRVSHATLGTGTVVGIEGSDARTVARISFGGTEKRLLVRMAPLEKL